MRAHSDEPCISRARTKMQLYRQVTEGETLQEVSALRKCTIFLSPPLFFSLVRSFSLSAPRAFSFISTFVRIYLSQSVSPDNKISSATFPQRYTNIATTMRFERTVARQDTTRNDKGNRLQNTYRTRALCPKVSFLTHKSFRYSSNIHLSLLVNDYLYTSSIPNPSRSMPKGNLTDDRRSFRESPIRTRNGR